MTFDRAISMNVAEQKLYAKSTPGLTLMAYHLPFPGIVSGAFIDFPRGGFLVRFSLSKSQRDSSIHMCHALSPNFFAAF